MQIAANSSIAAFMFHGGSFGRIPESFWKNTNHGNLMPACRNTPADAAVRTNHASARWLSAAACVIIDLVTKPEVNGNDEIASAPMMPQYIVIGIVR